MENKRRPVDMCANVHCSYCRHDKCFAPQDEKLFPYTYTNSIENSINKCSQYKNVGNPFYK